MGGGSHPRKRNSNIKHAVVKMTTTKEKRPVEEQSPQVLFLTKRPRRTLQKSWYSSRSLRSREGQKEILAEQVASESLGGGRGQGEGWCPWKHTGRQGFRENKAHEGFSLSFSLSLYVSLSPHPAIRVKKSCVFRLRVIH